MKVLLYFSTIMDIMMDVVKEVIAELITESIGGYFGISKRTGTSGWIDMMINAAKKATIDKKNGC